MEYHNPLESIHFDDEYLEQLRRISAGIDLVIISAESASIVTLRDGVVSVDRPNRPPEQPRLASRQNTIGRLEDEYLSKLAVLTTFQLSKTASVIHFAAWAADQESVGITPDPANAPGLLDFSYAATSSATAVLPDGRRVTAGKTLLSDLGPYATSEKHVVQLDDGQLRDILDITLIDGKVMFADRYLQPAEDAFLREVIRIVGASYYDICAEVLVGRFDDEALIRAIVELGIRMRPAFTDEQITDFLERFRERAEAARQARILRLVIDEGGATPEAVAVFRRALELAT